MAKQYTAFYVSWRQAQRRPMGFFASERDYGVAGAAALETKLNEIAADGWIIDRILPSTGLTPQQTAAYTVIAFK